MILLPDQPEKTPLPGYFALCNDGGQFRILDATGRKHRMRPEPGTPVHYVAGTQQVETATVVAASGATSNGNLVVTVTAAGLVGSPLAVNVPLTTAADTAAKVATAIRAALGAVSAITDLFTVLDTDDDFDLTRNVPVANDATLNIAIAAGLGVTAALTSTNTTAGVARVFATVGSKGDELFDNDFRYIAVADVSTTSTSGWEKSAIAAL
jgi:hypothetical protein